MLLFNVAEALIDIGYITIRSKEKNTLAGIIKNLTPFSANSGLPMVCDNHDSSNSQLFKSHLTLALSLGSLRKHDLDGSENLI